MSMPRLVQKAVLAGVLISVPVAVRAQGVFDMGVLTNTVTIPNRAARPAPRPRTTVTPGESAIRELSATLSGQPPAGARNVQLTYASSPALQRQAVDGYIQRMRHGYPEAARVMSAHFASNDYHAIYRRLMSGASLRDDDAADVVTAYTLLNWQIAKQDASKISSARVQAARDQIAPALAANPRLASPAARGALGEEMKLLYVTLHAGWQGAVRDGNTARYSDGVARKWRQQSGRDLRTLSLTDAGFSHN